MDYIDSLCEYMQEIAMRIQNSILVMATVAIMGIFISTIDACYVPNPFEEDNDAFTSDLSRNSEFSCDLCPNSSKLYHISVLRGNKELYMFVDILSTDTCCNVVANHAEYLTDARGKRYAHVHGIFTIHIAIYMYYGKSVFIHLSYTDLRYIITYS